MSSPLTRLPRVWCTWSATPRHLRSASTHAPPAPRTRTAHVPGVRTWHIPPSRASTAGRTTLRQWARSAGVASRQPALTTPPPFPASTNGHVRCGIAPVAPDPVTYEWWTDRILSKAPALQLCHCSSRCCHWPSPPDRPGTPCGTSSSYCILPRNGPSPLRQLPPLDDPDHHCPTDHSNHRLHY